MPDGFDISLLGDKELQRKLTRLVPAVQRKVLKKALRKAGKVVLAAARAAAPVRTGNLRRFLRLGDMKSRRDRVGVEVRTGTRDELGIPQGSRFYYPAHIELGTRKLPARPYLRPALKGKETEALAIISSELRSGIIREARRG